MNICSYEPSCLDKMKRFIAQCDYLPFFEYGISRDVVSNYIIEEISDTVSNGGFVFVAKEAEEIIGLIDSESLKWDSTHFGIETAKINYLLASGDYFKSLHTKEELVTHLLRNCYNRLTLHLSARVNKEDLSSIHALENKSFRLMDVLVTYSYDLRNTKGLETAPVHPVRSIRPCDLPKLAKIAVECFGQMPVATDRFHADPVLPKEKSDELYIEWLVNFSQDPSNGILVAEINGNPVGFNLCKVNKSISDKIGLKLGTMVLTAVKYSERNKLVGVSLLNASISWFRDKVYIIESGGQVSNYPIQRVWSKVGFKIMKSQCTFHWSALPDSFRNK